MPDANLLFDFENKTPAELDFRRREIIHQLQTQYKDYDDEAIPFELLKELAVLTSMVRKRTAGPPKVVKSPKVKKGPKNVDDLLNML